MGTAVAGVSARNTEFTPVAHPQEHVPAASWKSLCSPLSVSVPQWPATEHAV